SSALMIFFFQAEDGIRDFHVTGVQTCALPIYANWVDRLSIIPAFMVGTIGLSLNSSRAVIEGLLGRRTPFLRTPKYGSHFQPEARPRLGLDAWLEIGLCAYSFAGLLALLVAGEWGGVPFQLFFATGFALVVMSNFAAPRFQMQPAAHPI